MSAATVGVAAVLAALVAACASTNVSNDDKQVDAQALEPYGEHEECAKLAAGDRIEYTFGSDTPVNFNIHYHDGAAIVEPIVREAVTQDAGVFAPPLAQDYCLMWQAGPSGATLDYRLRVRRAER
jgi:hypothetical protein